MAPAKKEPDLSTYRGRFAERLKALRIKAGLSVEESADELMSRGVIKNQRTLYHWESGRGLPKIEDLPEISQLYGLKSTRNLLPEK